MTAEFEYRHEFASLSPGQVFDSVIKWLEAEGAKIKAKNGPTSIAAVQGSMKTVSVWKRDAKKKLLFTIQAKGQGADVFLKASPGSLMYADDVNSMRQEIFINWGLLAEEI